MSRLVTRAPAKINLTLHVLGRRAGDGYHELESLVAFTGSGDTLILDPGDRPRPDRLGPDGRPCRAPRRQPRDPRRPPPRPLAARGCAHGAFHLVKRLPVAAGIGGGSSDAAAALRLLARLNGIAPDDPAI